MSLNLLQSSMKLQKVQVKFSVMNSRYVHIIPVKSKNDDIRATVDESSLVIGIRTLGTTK